MPNHRTKARWEHPTYKYAYVREYRGMACTVIHGSAPLSTGFVWQPSSRDHAMRILNQRLQAYLYGKPRVEGAPMTCGELLEEFAKVGFPRLAKPQRGMYLRYMKALVPYGLRVTDTARIRNHILETVREAGYHPNTARKALTKIRAVFAFGIDEGLLRVNPVHGDMIPREVASAPKPYTDEEMAVALERMDGRYKAFVEFLMATGCRAQEACDALWSHVKADHLVIDGKRTRRDTPRPRVIPYHLAPELPDLTERARTAPWRGSERIFGLKTYQRAADAFRKAMPDGRGLHGIRKWKVNKWVRQGLPEVVIQAIAGHNEAVSRKHYRTPYTAEELVRLSLDSTPSASSPIDLKAP